MLGGKLFDYPKHRCTGSSYAAQVDIRDDPDAAILDFFAGSGSTGHAVMEQNAADGEQRRYILVQAPESTGATSEAARAGYTSIADLAQERLRRAGRVQLYQDPVNTTGGQY